MPPLQLLFAVHNHQPDGNFGHVFEQAYSDCYRPLLDALAAAPHLKIALHHTGPLLEWIERERPDYFEVMRGMVTRGQVELLGGGFYEPMLAVLPERDARGQIAMMNDYLAERFGVRPEGMWLAERVWEPSLAKLIADCGMKFTLVDDGHFRAAGLEGPLRGYYVTEKAGTPLAIFPIEKRLREAIPFLKAWETLDVLASLRDERAGAVTYGDDGEKFGVWPHTKEWVFGKGWLAEFLRLMSERRDVVETVHFGDFLKNNRPTGRVYLPTASYEEMGEWALPAHAQAVYNEVRRNLKDRNELERARPFIRGGIWQAFLAKYPESNFMHKKMILVSEKLEKAEEKLGGSHALDNARRELYRAQCNCSYWHGLFGGLYLNYLRDAVYHHLIEAEVQADRVLGLGDKALAERRDLDADLADEIVLANHEATAYLKPDAGGGVYELDFRPKRFNLCNVLARRAEGYHDRLREAAQKQHQHGGGPVSIHDLTVVKSEGLEELLVEDRHGRMLFVDHFLGEHTTLEDLARGSYEENGDFANGVYEIVELRADGRAEAKLRRRGRVSGVDVQVEKRVTLEGGTLACNYRITSAQPTTIHFAPEVALTLLAGDAPDRYYRGAGVDERKLASRGETGGSIELVNEWDKFFVRVSSSPETTLWRFPVETASQSEAGFERTYQASILVPVFRNVSVEESKAFEARVQIDLVAM